MPAMSNAAQHSTCPGSAPVIIHKVDTTITLWADEETGTEKWSYLLKVNHQEVREMRPDPLELKP